MAQADNLQADPAQADSAPAVDPTDAPVDAPSADDRPADGPGADGPGADADRLTLAAPPPGETVRLAVAPGQAVDLGTLDTAAATVGRDGDDLTIDLDDGGRLVLVGFFGTGADGGPPVLLVGEVAIPAEAVIAALDTGAPLLEPAAGPQAGQAGDAAAAPPGSNGFAFSPADPVPLGAGLDPVDLLPPTALAFAVPDGTDDAAGPEDGPDAAGLAGAADDADDAAGDGGPDGGSEPPADTAPPTVDAGPGAVAGSAAVAGLKTAPLAAFPALAEGRPVAEDPAVDLPDLAADAGSLVAGADTDLVITFVDEDAGLDNTLGAYSVAADGTITNVQILFTSGQARFSGGDLVRGKSTAVYQDAQAGHGIGFFVIQDGESQLPGAVVVGDGSADPTAGTFLFVEPGVAPATAEEALAARFRLDAAADPADPAVPELYFLPTGGGAPQRIDDPTHPIWHSFAQPALNPDGALHAIAGADPASGVLRIAIEDLPGGGDRDFNDLVFDVEAIPQLVAALPAAPLLAGPTIADPDSSAMSGLVVTMENALPGDRLVFSEGYGVANGELTFNGVGTGILAAVSYAVPGEVTVTLTGTGPTGLYQDALASLRFTSEDTSVEAADNGNDGVREVTVTVTDAEGNVSPDALTTTFTVRPPDADALVAGTTPFSDGPAGSSIAGDDEANVIDGNDGNDAIFGYAGNDDLIGGSGSDGLFGGRGDDLLDGQQGRDFLFGNAGDDRLFGRDGDDELDGGDGADRLYGGDGSDFLHGGPGDDALFGGGRDDVLFGGLGDDRLTGGDGADRFVWQAEDLEPGGVDAVADFDLSEGDSLDFGGALALAPGEDLSDAVTLVADGADALLRVDPDGPGGPGGPAEAFAIRLEGVSVGELFADTPGVSAGDGEAELVAALQANNTLVA